MGCPRITNSREFSFLNEASKSSKHCSRNLKRKRKNMNQIIKLEALIQDSSSNDNDVILSTTKTTKILS